MSGPNKGSSGPRGEGNGKPLVSITSLLPFAVLSLHVPGPVIYVRVRQSEEKARRQPAAAALRSLTFTSPSQLRVTPVCLSVWSDPLWFKSVSLPRRVSVAVVTITHRRVSISGKARLFTVYSKTKLNKMPL
ncbi:hypothetical protein E2C01_046661 [Portunus trituberculatus]|uniref:Uncharacterized protein n=1 Tax=Portunus trituberculatus TaxID=210409 RepID=A0A5B7G6B0_PORTR|nr:hypothetical protein [Portunus trituberculatus]